MSWFPSPHPTLVRRSTPSSSPPSGVSPSDANVALAAIIASVSFISLLMLVCVCRTLRRHPGQLNWFIGRPASRPSGTAADLPTAASAASGTGPRRLSVIQDEITREYYRRSAIMAVAGPRVGPTGLSTAWDPSKPPSELYTPPPPYLSDHPSNHHEGLAIASSSASPFVHPPSSLSLPQSPVIESSTIQLDPPTPSSRRPRPQTIDDVLGLPASSPDLRAVDPPPPAYAPFSDIPLVDMMDDNVPIAQGAGLAPAAVPYLAGHVRFARQHERPLHPQDQDLPHRQERGPASNLPTGL